MSSRNLRVLDLRTEKNLDVLEVDDQISTGQHPDVWDTCQRLVDAARRWWTDIDAIVYRSRTTPESSLNYAFFGDDDLDRSAGADARPANRRPHPTLITALGMNLHLAKNSTAPALSSSPVDKKSRTNGDAISGVDKLVLQEERRYAAQRRCQAQASWPMPRVSKS